NSIYLSAEELLIFHNSYGSWLGEQARIFIEENSLDTDLIASHGHTTHHQPQNGLTFQIGSGQHLANASGIVTVCDFRTNDVALGGQGAPLVPIGDKLLLDQYDFCLNLGGISNISFDRNDKRVAYDIGLANMILNYITDKIGLLYDKGGQLAAAGKINARMLEQLNALEYYKLPFPKSTGYEWFVSEVVPVVEHTSDSIENLLHTAVHHICEQIAIQLRSFTPVENSSLLITGGGALNHYMIATLQEKLGADIKVVVPSEILIEYKEALVFALMGVLRLEKATNVFSSVTGAPRDSCSGVVYYPS
ncbi:MAG: anhydro-N-acetylmuramic acid kinase, partial [Eudoraea sp.]|nr:anhydro-N-acetylmuramic acid kinase [Eudoraea sp.]